MADYRAISAVCEAIIWLLQAKYRPELFPDQSLEFIVASAYDLSRYSKDKKTGVSLYLYQVLPEVALRNAPHRSAASEFQPPVLPLELNFLLTAWARDAGTQHAILGWMMRVLEDHPVLTAAMLNRAEPGPFQPHETVEISPLGLSNEALLSIWQSAAPSAYQLSIPYAARGVSIGTYKSQHDAG